MALTQSQIIEQLTALDESLTKKQVKLLLTGLAQLAYDEAKNGFVLPGLGKLVLAKRKARKGRNPATGETINIPAKTVLKFRIAKAAKDAVLETKKLLPKRPRQKLPRKKRQRKNSMLARGT